MSELTLRGRTDTTNSNSKETVPEQSMLSPVR